MTTQQNPSVDIQAIYTNGISLEIPERLRLFDPELANAQLPVTVNGTSNFRQIAEDTFEVNVKMDVISKKDDKDLYLLEITQSAITKITGADKSQLDQILSVGLPSHLVSYIRPQIATTLMSANLPVIHIPDMPWTKNTSLTSANDEKPKYLN